MKKNLLMNLTLALFAALLISGCKKAMTESTEETVQTNLPDASLKNQCQLTRLNIEGFDHHFHYNSQGLADEWRIEYGSGIPDVYTMEYDNDNKLSRAWYHYNGELIGTVEFEWAKNLLTEEHWDYSGFLFDVLNIYDKKDQMIKREISYGYTATIDYSPIGNVSKAEIFFDGELLDSREYTYNIPNRNAFLAIRGIPYGFPFVWFVFSKWWETSEKITVFQNGIPYLIYDPDPAQIVMQLGFQNYPIAIVNYDRVSNTYNPYGFEYQNCGPESDATAKVAGSSSLPILAPGKKANTHYPLLMGSPDAMRKQIEKMRTQIK
jgi:hypothetical protein